MKIFSNLVKHNQLLIYFHSLYLPHKSIFGLQVYKIPMIQFKVEYGAYTPDIDNSSLNLAVLLCLSARLYLAGLVHLR